MMHILVVDDERAMQALFSQFFKSEIKKGLLSFHYCLNAEDALKYIEINKDLHTILILSDISMPGMNGLELLKIIKETYPQLKVFIITAYGDERNHKTAMHYGADDFVTKPIDFQTLKKKLDAIQNDNCVSR